MSSECTEPNWNTIMTHEAGHAVAALALWSEVADITLRSSAPNEPANRASYNLPDVEYGCFPNHRSPLERVIVYAAGAKAEEVLLGNDQSQGFGSDQRKIQVVQGKLTRDVDADYLRKQGLPNESLRAALENIPNARMDLDKVNSEISSSYQATKKLIIDYQNAITRIARAALQRIHDGSKVDGTIVLSADQVQSLWNECPCE